MKVVEQRRRVSLVAAIAAIVCSAGAAAGNPGEAEFVGADATDTAYRVVTDTPDGQPQARARYLVGLKELPLAMSVALPRRGNGRIALESNPAQSYLARLRSGQETFLGAAEKQLGRKIATLMRFQHAYNGFVAEFTDAEADALRRLPEVESVQIDRAYRLNTDSGPGMINAPAVWDGSGTLGNLASKGAGVVIGIIDSGINTANPAYAAVGDDGYPHVNPLGAGNYLGWCNPANANHVAARDICNDKVIGGWDFMDALADATMIEARGFEDENGHGSHTASTAVGNARTVTFNGIQRNVSGVAPHANLVIYDTCYTDTAARGFCPFTATTAAVNQAVADGIVDVLSFSIAGGNQPWNDATSRAFLAAQNAGIIVVAAAGNSGPTPGTVSHLEPWTITVGGTMHNRTFGFNFSVTAPGAPPPGNVQNITVRPGAAPIAAASLAGPLIVSPNFANGNSDGCNAYPANHFRRTDGGGAAVPTIAVLRLDATNSGCGSGARRTAALNAGAAGVIFVDVAPLSLGAAGTSYSMLLADWNRVAAHIAGDPAAAARIDVPLAAGPGSPDAVYYSTSRGPNPFALLKPDVAAPGVDILAAWTRWASAAPLPFGGAVNPANDTAVNVISGTSMATPHVAGATALLRSLNRAWTPAQIKSALSTTAKPELMEVDGSTPTTPFATGAGRIDVARAANAGLILDETGANYLAADPASGGDPSQLNIASFQNLVCVGTCTFPRSLRSTRTMPVTWTATVNGFAAGLVTVTPATFSVANAGLADIRLSADSLQLPQNQTVFGELVLTPSIASIPTARMPIALRRALPEIDIAPASLAASVAAGQSVTRNLSVRNIGNPTIDWSIVNAGTAPYPVQRQAFDGLRGNASDFFVGSNAGFYQAEDFSVDDPGTLRSLDVEGFLSGTGGNLQVTATQITFKVYADAAGQPAGQPEAGAAGELYSCTRTPAGANSAGLIFRSTDGAAFGLDLAAAAAAGCPAAPALATGVRYWATAYPTVPGNSSARRWFFGRALTSNGLAPMSIGPGLGIPAWTAVAPVAGPPASIASLALSVTTNVNCNAPWLSAAPNAGSLGVAGAATPLVTANAATLAAGNYRGFVCVSSNGTDADEAVTGVPFALEVTAPNNQAPAFTADSFTFAVAAAAVNGAAVGTASAADPNAADALTYAITAGNSGNAFAIDASTGAITVAAAPLVPNAVFTLTVSVTDAAGLSDTATVQITVGDAVDRIFRDGFQQP